MSDACPSSNSQLNSRVACKWLILGVVILCLDQLSKWLVYHYLPLMDPSLYWYPYGGIGVFQSFAGIEFSITHMTNTGAAWGFLGNYQFPLIILRVGLIALLTTYLFHFNKHSSWQFPLILIIFGALGNVIDYFVYGHVVDMLHFVLWGYDFPVFNLADTSISVGIFSLFFLSWMAPKT